MKKLLLATLIGVSLSSFSTFTMAAQNNCPNLDKVSFQLSSEQWASTKTAKVIVGVNASLTDSGLASIQSDVMQNLGKIAKADWHITQFNRSKNQSGLEQLYVQAQARIPESELANIRKNAKAISKPGTAYSIAGIDFSPSQAEIQKVRADLRNKIYGEVNAELMRLNKEYPQAKFHLHTINFDQVRPMPVANTMILAKVATQEAAPAMAVSNKVTVNANVVLAAQEK